MHANPVLSAPKQFAFWRTIRFRWALWNTIMVLATALLALYALRYGARWALLKELDEVLSDDAREVLLSFSEHEAVDWAQLKAELAHQAIGHQNRGWTVTFFDSAGYETWTTPGAQLELPSPRTQPQGEIVTTDGVRHVWHPTPNFNGEVASFAVGVRLDLVTGMLARLDRWGSLAVLGLLGLAPLLGYWSAARAARTVGEITDLAARLQADQLDDRLPVLDTGDELDRLSQTINGFLDRIAEDSGQRRP